MDEPRIIHRFPKNESEEVRFSIREYKDRQYLDMRIWFLPKEGSEYCPTKKGMTLSLEHLPEISRAIDKASKCVSVEAGRV